MIRAKANPSDPIHLQDLIAFIYVFAIVLRGAVPRKIVQEHKDDIYDVMDELVGIVEEEDVLSWPSSRKECVESASRHFQMVNLQDHHLVSGLIKLVHTWNPQWSFRSYPSVPYP